MALDVRTHPVTQVCPRFDSPSVFAAILDADRGGLFRIGADGAAWTSKQLYLPDDNLDRQPG